MSVDVSFVTVAFHSSSFLPGAIASFRDELARHGLAGEVVVVEHSEDGRELAAAAALAPEHLIPRANRGYAAGLNAGIALARGKTLLLANPDLRLNPGCLAALLGGLDEGWSVVGPQFVSGAFLHPPADPQRPAAELRRWLAGRSAGAWRRQLAAEVRRWNAVWQAGRPVAVETLSGALLALRAVTAARLGPLDDGYFLYFEETDWLRRETGAKAVVPAAMVHHAWAHGGRQGDLPEVFARSRRRYYGRHFGLRGRLAARLRHRGMPASVVLQDTEGLPRARLWLVSPAEVGFPAAGVPDQRWTPSGAAKAFRQQHPHAGPLVVSAWDAATARLEGPWRFAPPSPVP